MQRRTDCDILRTEEAFVSGAQGEGAGRTCAPQERHDDLADCGHGGVVSRGARVVGRGRRLLSPGSHCQNTRR